MTLAISKKIGPPVVAPPQENGSLQGGCEKIVTGPLLRNSWPFFCPAPSDNSHRVALGSIQKNCRRISSKSVAVPIFSQPQGRDISKQATQKSQESTWNKICRWIREFVCWIKRIFIVGPSKKQEEPAIEIITPAPIIHTEDIDTSFLRPNDPSRTLARLSNMTVENVIQSISTEEVFKAVPRKNALRLGYDDPIQYQTALGDLAIAAETALIGLGIFGLSRQLRSSCMQGKSLAEYARVYQICSKEAADFWQNTSGKTLLATGALLLAATFYAQSQGWLGKLLHDRSSEWRGSRIETLFQSAMKELTARAKTDPTTTENLARRILKNSELIEASLHIDLQLPKEKAAQLTDLLKSSAEEILNPDPTFGKTS